MSKNSESPNRIGYPQQTAFRALEALETEIEALASEIERLREQNRSLTNEIASLKLRLTLLSPVQVDD